MDPIQNRNDDEIAYAVCNALLNDLAVPDRTISTAVSSGIVVLEGAVSSSGERAEAGRVTASVPGVVTVLNRIAVWPPDLESELVRETSRELLEAARGDDPP